ncbi:MAG: glucose-1-phosphate thymidylyltransferase RfbA [Gammaproteobacteria bacterium]|nr:glucose-1-phosphate thymidylyltransferase RfbA [Gammaproteobacteria bacterium]
MNQATPINFNSVQDNPVPKGIILAGGTGSRLHPITLGVSKQLMPVYDKPMIYYPLTTLMQAGIREILIITTPQDSSAFSQLLGDGSDWGVSISYAVQPKPEGLAQAFIIGADFVDNSGVCLILGDNLFYGTRIEETLRNAVVQKDGASVFAYYVNDPERYGVVTLDADQQAIDLEEKPTNPKSHYAVTGLYMYDNAVVDIARDISPSARGELEITDVNKVYLKNKQLRVALFDRGTAWLDTGTIQSLLDAANFIRVLEERQGLKIGCPEEIAWRHGFIDSEQLGALAKRLVRSGYGQYLMELLSQG